MFETIAFRDTEKENTDDVLAESVIYLGEDR
jgi:hypothetical protein